MNFRILKIAVTGHKTDPFKNGKGKVSNCFLNCSFLDHLIPTTTLSPNVWQSPCLSCFSGANPSFLSGIKLDFLKSKNKPSIQTPQHSMSSSTV